MTIELSAQKREVLGKKVKNLREQDLIPAELYGRGFANEHLSVPVKEFDRVFEEAGKSQVVNLNIGEKGNVPVLIYNIQRHPVTSKIIAVDFYQVHMDEKTEATVPIELVGESLAVKDKDGVLLQVMQEVDVEALPSDIPKSIEVDISLLNEIDDGIHIKDLKISDKVEILSDPEAMVVTVQAKMTEEEEQRLEEEASGDVSKVEVEGEEEEEEEEKVEEKE